MADAMTTDAKTTDAKTAGAKTAAVKICIATPAYGEMFYAPYVQSLYRLLHLFARRGWGSLFTTVSYAEISESRNYLLTHWYDKTDASHLLFVDADMGFEQRLVADMMEFDRPVVGAVYPKRQIDVKRLTDLVARGETAERADARAHDFVVRRRRGAMRPKATKGFIQVDGCGAGVLLIQRACIAELLKKAPKLSDTSAKKSSPLAAGLDRLIRAFDPLVADGLRMSEDFSFCQRWRMLCGGEVWANIAHPVTHIGLRRFAARYAEAMPAGPRVTVKTGAPVTLGRGKAGGAAKGNGGGNGKAGAGARTVTGRLAAPGKDKPGGG